LPKPLVDGERLDGLPAQLHPVRVKERESGCPAEIVAPKLGESVGDRLVAVAGHDPQIAAREVAGQLPFQLGSLLAQLKEVAAIKRRVAYLEADPGRALKLCPCGAACAEALAGEGVQIDAGVGLVLGGRGEAVKIPAENVELAFGPVAPRPRRLVRHRLPPAVASRPRSARRGADPQPWGSGRPTA
jgi:hypothetical protein